MREVYGNIELARITENEAAQGEAAYTLATKKLFPSEPFENFYFEGGCSKFVGRSLFILENNAHAWAEWPPSRNIVGAVSNRP